MADKATAAAARRKAGKPIRHTIDEGKETEYEIHFTPSKTDPMLLAFMEGDQSRFGREQLAWLKRGLRDVDQAYLWDRVNDYDDTYSMDDLMKLADLLWGEAAGNPTESPTG